MVQLTMSIGSDTSLAPNKRQAIIWTKNNLVWWRVFALQEMVEKLQTCSSVQNSNRRVRKLDLCLSHPVEHLTTSCDVVPISHRWYDRIHTHEITVWPVKTHLPWAKWPPFRRRYFHVNFRERKILYFVKISLKFVPKGPIDNNPILVYIIAWRRIGDKPLSEPKLTEFTDAYMWR